MSNFIPSSKEVAEQYEKDLMERTELDQVIRVRQELERIRLAICRTFATEDGQFVVEHLKGIFHVEHSSFVPHIREDGSFFYDDTQAKLRDGQRSVVLYIMDQMKIPPIGDDPRDISKSPKVFKP